VGDVQGRSFNGKTLKPSSKKQWKRLSAANIPALQFAGHNFRIEAATKAAVVGLQGSVIQTLGDWRS